MWQLKEALKPKKLDEKNGTFTVQGSRNLSKGHSAEAVSFIS
jgi:hypothetical protein